MRVTVLVNKQYAADRAPAPLLPREECQSKGAQVGEDLNEKLTHAVQVRDGGGGYRRSGEAGEGSCGAHYAMKM